MGMVKKMVGTNILVDEINKLLGEKLYKYIDEQKLNILGNPLPKENQQTIDWEQQTDFEFTYELGIAPEVKVGITEKDKFEKLKIVVSQKMIDDHTQKIATSYGKMEDVETVSNESLLQGKFEEMDGKKVKIPGFIVPLEFDDNQVVTKFFLVPFFGACIHVPPPPPNQIIYVDAPNGVELTALYDPFWISGTLNTTIVENDVATSAYAMTMDKIENYY